MEKKGVKALMSLAEKIRFGAKRAQTMSKIEIAIGRARTIRFCRLSSARGSSISQATNIKVV
ncbi:hypothetical protein BTH82_08220 [Lactobacillus delbrueckii subsp. bulgaricus]|nr:hypothetical protein [Lactobacillus delbrueckii subsp. bulgaricus]MBT8873673.1 hypothetical protein [Lactobacillus delbrueckii subsp. bulgaricus]